MATPERVKAQMEKNGLAGVNKPKRTPGHPDKSHIVMAKEGDKYKLIRFGEQGADTKPPTRGESAADKAKRASFKARHASNIAKGKMSAAYWSDRVKWMIFSGILLEYVMRSWIDGGIMS